MLKRLFLLFSLIAIATAAQAPTTCGGTQQHCVILTWQASPSQAGCLATNTPPCSFTYSVFAGTTPGGEAATAVASTSNLTYTYPVTLGPGPGQTTYYFTVVAVETLTETNGTIVDPSAPSAEVSGGPFPPVAQPPTTQPPTNVGTTVPCTPARKQACRANNWGCCTG